MVQLLNEGIRPPTLLTVSKGTQYDDFTIHRLYGSGNFSNVSHHHIFASLLNNYLQMMHSADFFCYLSGTPRGPEGREPKEGRTTAKGEGCSHGEAHSL